MKAPSLRALEAFEAFGRVGSVTKAAAELGVSAGAVSQQLRKAEEALGINLVERRGRTVALTNWGRRYHEMISKSFAGFREAQEAIERMRMSSVLTISCLPSLASKWLTPALFDWQSRHAGTTVNLLAREIEPDLTAEEVDFRISYGGKSQNYDQYAELFTDWVVPACSPEFLARHPVKEPGAILATTLLGIAWARDHRQPPTWNEWAASIGEPYRKREGEVLLSLSSAAIDAAIQGRGFVLAQWSMAAADIRAGRLVVPFERPLRLAEPYFVAWERSALEKPLGSKLRSWIGSLGQEQNGATLHWSKTFA
ncbi:LysR family transcriptional regulator [Fulvimarina endophytica]|uniref:LysR family transcriptional regulator n=1 Tax=Fulvimarina endophytica TaxID=2293836 RepID=A0A371WZJ7_9HYPH|nr:LysR substrate-binding domain-containing protein [Fulvimarina endophytica]RFC62204.1 LysR family transcriptional regulator [Fulvimarina endophytica]